MTSSLQIKPLYPDSIIPTRAHDTDTGYDLYSHEAFEIEPLSSVTIGTGVAIKMPEGVSGMIMSRSGLNSKYNITSTGWIDPSYRGEIKVILRNHDTKRTFTFGKGSRISQLVLVKHDIPPINVVNDLDDTNRGCNGLGSTGV